MKNADDIRAHPDRSRRESEDPQWGTQALLGKPCAECGELIPVPRWNQRFCTESCKDRAGHRRRYGAQPKVLTCRRCAGEWTRPAQTGRLPHLCPECRGITLVNNPERDTPS